MSDQDSHVETNPLVTKMAEIIDKAQATQRKAVLVQTERICRDYEKQIDKLLKKIEKMETESTMSASTVETKSNAKKVRAPKAPH